MGRIKLAVLVSGRGSNLQSLIDACQDESFPAEIAIVISNKPDAYALVRAETAGIATLVIDHKNHDSREDFEDALHEALSGQPIGLICLAGFMRVLRASFVEKWEGRIINIHPSLLPKHKGLHTHQRALSAGDFESGCTVHFVTADMDEGPVILQRSVPVEKNDTADTLAARILEQEHIAYPEAVRIVAKRILNS